MAIVPPLLEVVSFARIERLLVAAARVPMSRAPDPVTASRWVDDLMARVYQIFDGLGAPW